MPSAARRVVATRGTGKLPRLGLMGLYAFTAIALLGYATFGLSPHLLTRFPQVAGFYGISFPFFAQMHIWLAWTVLALFLAHHAGRRWVAAFCALYAVSLAGELSGTTLGVPFGEYRYTEALGPRWFGHVPIVIPLSWFFMAIPSYAFARAALPASPGARVLLASLILLGWDLALDPAMSHATAYWIWADSGAYYGMPWLNLLGWYVTGLALTGALAGMRADNWIAVLPLKWLAAFYAVNLVLPMGMSAAAGLWGAVAATAATLALAGLLARTLSHAAGSRATVGEAAI